MKKLLVTGSSGFAGSFIVGRLADLGYSVVAPIRSLAPIGSRATHITVPDIGPDTDWHSTLRGVDAVVHLAGRAHTTSNAPEFVSELMRINVLGTRNLARQAAEHAKSFVFVSSVKVYGDRAPGGIIDARTPINPTEPYGESKARAEDAVRAVGDSTGLRTVIIRPPLLAGPSPKGNLAMLARLVRLGMPLPLASIQARRSLLSLHNLCDLICASLLCEGTGSTPLLAADNSPPTTPELVSWLADALGRKANLIRFPPAALAALLSALGGRRIVDRLMMPYVVDYSLTTELTGWAPTLSTPDALKIYFRHGRPEANSVPSSNG